MLDELLPISRPRAGSASLDWRKRDKDGARNPGTLRLWGADVHKLQRNLARQERCDLLFLRAAGYAALKRFLRVMLTTGACALCLLA